MFKQERQIQILRHPRPREASGSRSAAGREDSIPLSPISHSSRGTRIPHPRSTASNPDTTSKRCCVHPCFHELVVLWMTAKHPLHEPLNEIAVGKPSSTLVSREVHESSRLRPSAQHDDR
ncbi:hypothetical protein BD414DRAFT_472054 [Trametes punicea]|nr:hypothetical protein BD414DRAFT_472054 [Trametes punicea]